jgi:hypothetical protein
MVVVGRKRSVLITISHLKMHPPRGSANPP